MASKYQHELTIAIEAIRDAARLCRAVQEEVEKPVEKPVVGGSKDGGVKDGGGAFTIEGKPVKKPQ